MPGHTAYLTLAHTEPCTATIEVKRSVFLGVVRRADDETDARALVDQQRHEHRGAGHHCSAFILGPRAEVARSNDDGEPSGSAGSPMLEVLRGAGLSDVAAVVVRWFGGTLLGTGGLARAYAEALEEALRGAPVVWREPRVVSQVTVGHAAAGRVEAGLRGRGVQVLGTSYAAAATLRLATADLRTAQDAVAAVTQGSATACPVGTTWVERPVR